MERMFCFLGVLSERGEVDDVNEEVMKVLNKIEKRESNCCLVSGK